MACKECFHYEEPCKDYAYGKCWFFRNSVKNMAIDPVDLSVHGANGCSHFKPVSSTSIADMCPAPVEKNYQDTEDVPF